MCGREGTQIRYLTRSFGKGEHLFVIEDIPYLFCPNCGERYFTAATMREIERIKMAKTDRILFRSCPSAPRDWGAATSS